jgi:hypothetical protein
MSSVILHATMITHFPLIFSAQPFSIEQGYSFAKWLSSADGGATHLHGAIAQPLYDFIKSFFIVTLLSHFYYSLLSHFSLL